MDWKDIGSKFVSLGLPILGGAVGGPAGVALGKVLSLAVGSSKGTPDDVLDILTNSSEALQKAKEFEATHQETLLKLTLEHELEMRKADSVDIGNVNTTMQEEAKSDHWPTYSWRPYNGFLFGTTIFCCYFLLPLLGIPIPVIPESVWLAWGAVLGVASWFRGKAQADPTIKTDNRG